MTVVQFLLASQNLPFAIAIGSFLAMALIELVGMAFGGISHAVDHGADVDLGHTPGGEFLEWLNFGAIPTLIYITLCLFGFGMSGYLLQWACLQLGGVGLLYWPVASAIALMCTLPFVKFTSAVLKKTLLKDETDVTTEDALLGRLGIITLGRATFENPSQAKVIDKFGQLHYVVVVPLFAEASYETGDEVILVERNGARFRVIGRDDSLSDVTDRLMGEANR